MTLLLASAGPAQHMWMFVGAVHLMLFVLAFGFLAFGKWRQAAGLLCISLSFYIVFYGFSVVTDAVPAYRTLWGPAVAVPLAYFAWLLLLIIFVATFRKYAVYVGALISCTTLLFSFVVFDASLYTRVTHADDFDKIKIGGIANGLPARLVVQFGTTSSGITIDYRDGSVTTSNEIDFDTDESLVAIGEDELARLDLGYPRAANTYNGLLRIQYAGGSWAFLGFGSMFNHADGYHNGPGHLDGSVAINLPGELAVIRAVDIGFYLLDVDDLIMCPLGDWGSVSFYTSQ